MAYDPVSEISYLWRYCTAYSVFQAAALIAGYEPGDLQGWLCLFDDRQRLPGYAAAEAMLVNAIERKSLKANIRHDVSRMVASPQPEDKEIQNGEQFVVNQTPSVILTTIARGDLVEWLDINGVQTQFVFPLESLPPTDNAPDYLDPKHPRYSAKLAAAIQVWLAMEDATLLSARSPKDAMTSWLNSRFVQLGLSWKGERSNTAISEVVQVANWNTKGGSPKTPER